MLATVGLTACSAWWYPLYGGVLMLAARRDGTPDGRWPTCWRGSSEVGVTDAAVLRGLQRDSAETAEALQDWVHDARDAGRRVVGYGAASRAVPLLNRAGIGPDLVEVVVDASPAKSGRRMPGVGIPIVPPQWLDGRGPVDVLLFVPDLLDEVRRRLPQVEADGGRWVLTEPMPRVVTAACGRTTVPRGDEKTAVERNADTAWR